MGVSIHKGAGQFKVIKPYLKSIENNFSIKKSQMKIIDRLKTKIGNPNDFHQSYRLPINQRQKDKLIGPEELLGIIKRNLLTPIFSKVVYGFADIEKHEPDNYSFISCKNSIDDIKYKIPEPILFGYYFLNKALVNLK